MAESGPTVEKDKLFSLPEAVHHSLTLWYVRASPAGARCGWGELQRARREPDAGARHHESAAPPGLPTVQPNQRQTRASAGP